MFIAIGGPQAHVTLSITVDEKAFRKAAGLR